MLMDIRNINRTSYKTCCKDCARLDKRGKRGIKRAERQAWKKLV